VRGGRHLDQVEIRFLRQTKCILDTDDADLFALRADEADLRYADAIVDAGLVDGGSFCCRWSSNRRAKKKPLLEREQRPPTTPTKMAYPAACLPEPKPWPTGWPEGGR